VKRNLSTRRARNARAIAIRNIENQRHLDNHRLNRAVRDAKVRVEAIRKQLEPAHRLRLQQQLAQWEAHLDSLEDDGVYAITKGQE
jgi:hypothetical protein